MCPASYLRSDLGSVVEQMPADRKKVVTNLLLFRAQTRARHTMQRCQPVRVAISREACVFSNEFFDRTCIAERRGNESVNDRASIAKDIDVVLDIRRNFQGDWDVKTDAKYEKVDANKTKFVLPLKSREKQTFGYEVTTRFGVNVTR